MIEGISKKSVSIESIAKKVINNEELIDDLLKYTSSDKAAIKYKSFKVLRYLAEHQPRILYPKWDFFVSLLDDNNTFLRAIGATIISFLTKVDTKNKFEEIFDKYYSLLEDESMINAGNIAGQSGIIAKAKPHLQQKITDKLLDIDNTHHSEECKNIIKGKAILSMHEYFDKFENKEKIIDFVSKELNNKRPATKKKAEKFLKKWNK